MLDRAAAIATWRAAEGRIYPSVMVNAELYQEYIDTVKGIADELRDVQTEDDLVTAWHERRDLATEVIARTAPTMARIMDGESVRAAAFCTRHREVTREHGKRIARERLEEAKMSGATWVVLFDDVTPLGSHTLEMHVRSGRALLTSTDLPLDGTRPNWELQAVQLDPSDGAYLLDAPPLIPTRKFDRQDEWEARTQQARLLLESKD